MIKTFLIVLTVTMLLSSPLTLVFAQTNDSSTSAQVTRVGGVASLRERILERIILFLKFDNNSNEQYQKELVEKRFAELNYVIDSGNWDPIEETSTRYSAYLGRVTQYVIDHKMVSKKDDLLQMYEIHSQILQVLLKNFEYNTGFWLLIQQDIDANKIYAQQIRDLK